MISNDLKFWIIRFWLLVGIIAGLVLLGKGVEELQAAGQEEASAHPARIFIAFFIVVIIDLVLAVNHARYKRIRFESPIKDQQEKVAIETLATLGTATKSNQQNDKKDK